MTTACSTLLISVAVGEGVRRRYRCLLSVAMVTGGYTQRVGRSSRISVSWPMEHVLFDRLGRINYYYYSLSLPLCFPIFIYMYEYIYKERDMHLLTN